MNTSNVSNLLHIAASRIARRVKSTDSKNGMSPARMSVLSILVKQGPLTLGELARIEEVRAPTMTSIIKGLEEEGYITRRSDKSDGRIVRVRISAKGKRSYQNSLDRRANVMDALLEDLSRKELQTLHQAAKILESHLTKIKH